jgi:hypothetical protein
VWVLLEIMEKRRWTGSHAVMAMLLAKGTSMSETDLVEPLRRELSARPVVVFLRENESCELRWHALIFCSAALYNVASISFVGNMIILTFDSVMLKLERTDRFRVIAQQQYLSTKTKPVLKASAIRLSEYLSHASVSLMFIAIVHVSVGPLVAPSPC